MPRIYTKTGDDGTTGLLYGGRISKADLVTEAYGTTDEAVAVARARPGARARTPTCGKTSWCSSGSSSWWGPTWPPTRAKRKKLDKGVSLVTEDMVRRLERRIDDLVALRPLPQVFIVPGANPASAALDLARSVVRRAERRVVELERAERDGEPRGPAVPEPTVGPDLRPRPLAGGRGRAGQPRGLAHATGAGANAP